MKKTERNQPSCDPREAARRFVAEAAHNWRAALEEATQVALARYWSQRAAKSALEAAEDAKEGAA